MQSITAGNPETKQDSIQFQYQQIQLEIQQLPGLLKYFNS